MSDKNSIRRSTFAWPGVVAIVLLAGCASDGKEPQGPEAPEAPEIPLEERVEKILSEPSDAEDYGQEYDCISQSRYRDVEIIDKQRIAFVGSRGRVLLNELRHPCPGLHRRATLGFVLRGSRLCAMDQFQIVEPSGIRGMRCSLGTFSVISEQQFESLKELLK